MMKTVGICLLLFTLFYAVRRLSAAQRARLELLGEVYDFLRYIRRQVKCYLLPLKDIAASYSTELLERCGFLDRLRSGENPLVSFTGEYRIADAPMGVLSAAFSSFGEGYVEDEIRSLDTAIEDMSLLLSKERAECAKRVKLYSVVGAAIGVGSLILVI